MPPVVIAAAIAAGGMVASGALTSRGQSKAAKTQAGAATESARIEDDATQRAEAFQREQAQQAWVENERVSRANYDQWVARQRALNEFRTKHGYGASDIPGYVPSQDPRFVGPPAMGAPQPGGPSGPGNALPPELSTTQPVPADRPSPMGEVGRYLPASRVGYQPYAPRSVDDYLMRARR